MTVLIIDDEPGLRQTVSLILAEEGYTVHTASDGEEALAAICNALTNQSFVRRFHADRRMGAMDLLLQERIPWDLPSEAPRAEQEPEPPSRKAPAAIPHSWIPPTTLSFPQVHVLGNGRLATWISAGGGGNSSWGTRN